MSGGSFDYVSQVYDFAGLIEKLEELERLQKALAGLPYASTAAADTAGLIASLRQVERTAMEGVARLRGVWTAVEWWKSMDFSEDQVREACAEHWAVVHAAVLRVGKP